MSVPVAFESAINENRRLIRKALAGAIFIKPYAESDPEIEQLWTPARGLIIPPGYMHVGLVRKADAAAFASETDTADVESWGHGEPTRRDLTADTTTLKFVMQESKRQVFELYHGLDLSAVKADADGNIVFDKARRPQNHEYRAFVISKDGDGSDSIYFARWLTVATVTGKEDQTWGEDEEIAYGVTLTGYTDSVVGTAVREIWAGPGINAVEMGFQAI